MVQAMSSNAAAVSARDEAADKTRTRLHGATALTTACSDFGLTSTVQSMVRLSDLHEAEAAHLQARADAMTAVESASWITPKPARESTVAIVSTAGLHRRSDPPFRAGAVDYRIIPGDVDFAECVLSHVSTNFDRSAFQQDPNISFPLDRLREMTDAGEISGVSQWHYSFMGAQPNHQALQETGEEVGRLLAADGVDVALLIPV